MKKIMFTLLALAAALPQAIAQEADSTRAIVNVDGQPLESLLTDAQKQAVKHLTVTGTLADEDYAYLRSGLLAQLDTLDLRRADIDTIPKLAFYCNPKDELSIILPEKLKHLSDSSLLLTTFNQVTYILTGKYPSVGIDVYSWHNEDDSWSPISTVAPSDDNIHCILKDGYIMSADSTVVYRGEKSAFDSIPEGIKTINERAFENNYVNDLASIPSTVDSIGDCAFAGLYHILPYDGRSHFFYLSCLATTPPRLGKNVFMNLPGGVYVPEESLDVYLTAEGWKDVVRGSLDDVIDPLSVKSPQADSQAKVCLDGSTCHIMSGKAMSAVSCYAADGKLLGKLSCNAKEAALPLNTLGALIILKVDYMDGTSETIKLKP